MKIGKVILKQYQALVNKYQSLATLEIPPEGWVCTVRKALNMSGAQLARRMGLSRARIAKLEQAELEGAVTIQSMKKTAEALGCRFVYAILPNEDIEQVIEARARTQAKELVDEANVHMSLESQELTTKQIEYEIERITQDILKEMPRNLWDDK